VFLDRDERVEGTRSTCSAVVHAIASAAGSEVQVRLVDWPADSTARIEVLDFNGAIIGARDGVTRDEAVSFEQPWSGEVLLRIAPEDVSAPGHPYTVSHACVSGCDLGYSRYPLFLMHGMAGTDAWLNVVTYWFGIVPHLEGLGYRVIAPAVDPFQGPEDRSRQWREHLDSLLAEGTARRVHVSGHSQGGLDARWVATHLDPDHTIASVTTVSAPHRGTAVTDVLLGLVEDRLITEWVLDELANAYADWVGAPSEQHLMEQLTAMSRPGMEAFNAEVPDREDIPYFSWAGRTCAVLDLLCQVGNGGEAVFIPLATTFWVLQIFEGESDGLVSIESARWGTFLGLLPADHMNEVGHLVGETAPGFNHLEFWASEAERLAVWERENL
jgi:triacylglycerol esterase/lipase EstA (alpha/beta hydrolase family)